MVTTLLVAVLYVTLIFSFTELTTAIPQAGGPYAYAELAFGPWGGLIAGLATTIEFLFAPPAIAYALGSYWHVLFPGLSVSVASILVFSLFGLINLFPVKHSVRFELFVTILAIGELLIFFGVALPAFRFENFSKDAWSGGVSGAFRSIPYAIWFFLAIEGVAMSAEETINPRRDIPLGYIAGIGTLLFLAFGVMVGAGGAVVALIAL